MIDSISRRELLMSLLGTGLMAALPSCATAPGGDVSGARTSSLGQLLPLSASRRRPNILLIITDQEFFELPLPPGYSLPNRDRLRAKGISFSNYYVSTAPCTPSRATLFTGQHVPFTKMFDNINFPYVGDLVPKPTLPALGSMMRRAGYYPAYKGKWHLTRDAGSEMDKAKTILTGALEPFGFSDYNEHGDFHGNSWTGYKHDPEIARTASEWLHGKGKSIAAEKPWFLTVGFVNPHDIMYADNNAPGEKLQVNQGPFDIKPPPEDPLYQQEWKVELPKTFKDSLETKPQAHRDYRRLADIFFGEMPLSREDMYLRNQNYYLNCLRDVDRHIGTVLDALESSGQAGNTIVVFTADHGDMMGAHGLRQKGPLVYKQNLNVPLVVVHPDIKGGGVVTSSLGSSLDIAPTLLGFAGVDRAMRQSEFPFLKGHDMGSILARPTSPGDRFEQAGGLLMTYDSLNSVDVDFMEAMVRVVEGGLKELELTLPPRLRPNFEKRGFLRGFFDGRYKLARYFGPVKYNRPKTFEDLIANNDVELYDLQTDPDELINLAHNPEQVRELLVSLNYKLEALISTEIGDDTTIDLPELPRLKPQHFQR